MVVKLAAVLPRVPGRWGRRGQWVVRVAVGPSLCWMCSIVMLALSLDVLDDESVVRGTPELERKVADDCEDALVRLRGWDGRRAKPPPQQPTPCVRVPLVERGPTSPPVSPPAGGTFRSPRPSLLPTA